MKSLALIILSERQNKTKKGWIKMSKQLQNLVEKAQEKGFARVNGRQREYGYVGKLEEKYAVEIKNNIIKLRHWGTQTLEIDTVNKKVLDVYGISNSDRDSINFILSKFNMPYHTHFYPSRYEFELHDDNENVIEVI